MGRISINDVIGALQDAGIRTEHSFPKEKMLHITEPVAAVSLLEASLRKQTMAVRVSVFAGDAVACENKALEVGTILSDMCGDCHVAACTFDGRNGLFCANVRAEFVTEAPRVKINNTLLEHVVAFTSWRMVDEDNQITRLDDALWNFRLEEFFPNGAEEIDDSDEPFLLMHINFNGSETFQDCYWTYQKRTWGSTGTRQLRMGTAAVMENG